jgi:acyl dehydratase
MKFVELTAGQEIPPLVKHPSTQQLVMWAGASGDFNPIHYDKDFALSRGLSGVVVHGQLVTAFLGQMVTDWLGESGSIRKISVSYKGMNYPGDMITCRGVINKISPTDGQCSLDIWAENTRGEKTVVGVAVVAPGA